MKSHNIADVSREYKNWIRQPRNESDSLNSVRSPFIPQPIPLLKAREDMNETKRARM
jgi:hypothetical protein